MASQITTVSIVCSTVCSGTDKKIKASRHWPLWGNPPATGGFPSQRASEAEMFIWMTLSCRLSAIMFSLRCVNPQVRDRDCDHHEDDTFQNNLLIYSLWILNIFELPTTCSTVVIMDIITNSCNRFTMLTSLNASSIFNGWKYCSMELKSQTRCLKYYNALICALLESLSSHINHNTLGHLICPRDFSNYTGCRCPGAYWVPSL